MVAWVVKVASVERTNADGCAPVETPRQHLAGSIFSAPIFFEKSVFLDSVFSCQVANEQGYCSIGTGSGGSQSGRNTTDCAPISSVTREGMPGRAQPVFVMGLQRGMQPGFAQRLYSREFKSDIRPVVARHT